MFPITIVRTPIHANMTLTARKLSAERLFDNDPTNLYRIKNIENKAIFILPPDNNTDTVAGASECASGNQK